VAGVDTTLAVDAIPLNVPTIVTVGWDTANETVFRATATSGTNSSNYTLTGVTRIKGSTGNLAEGLAVNCLNHEEYFNQYEDLITAAQEDATDAVATADAAANAALTINTTASSATPSPIITTSRNLYTITALAAAAELAVPTGTATNGMVLILRIKDNGTGRALTYNAIYRAIGVTLPTTTVISKTLYLGMIYNSADTKWDVIATAQEA